MNIRHETAQVMVEDLRALGYNVVSNSRGIKIQLPLFCSVTIAFQEDSIRFRSKGSIAPWSSSKWGSGLTVLLVGLLLVSPALFQWDTDLYLQIIFFTVCTISLDIYGFVVIESTMSTVRSLLISKYST
jgi:hypothetical protein